MLPNNPSLETARRHTEEGRLVAAEATYREALAAQPDSAEICKELGNVLLSLGRPQDAENLYQRAVELKPDFGEAYNNLGNTLRLSGRLVEAEQAFRRALALLPQNPQVLNNLGHLLLDAARPEEAEQAFRRAVVLQPDFAMAYLNRGRALRSLGRLEVAEKCYRQAIHLNPDYAEAHFFLGSLLELLELGDEAAQAYRQAIDLRPGYVEAFHGLGCALLRTDRYREAEDAFRKAIALKADYPQAHYGLGYVLHFLERTEEAVRAYQAAIALKPDYAEACYGLGVSLRRSGNEEEARRLYLLALSARPDYAEAYNGLGTVSLDVGNHEEAEHAFLKALELKPEYAGAKFNLSLLRLLQGRLEEGFQLYQERFHIGGLESVTKNGNSLYKLPDCKRWQGESPHGKSMVVLMEQGAGDRLMMMRYLPLLKPLGVKYLAVDSGPDLSRIMETLDCLDEVITDSTLDIDRFDLYCHIMSLPYCLKTGLSSIPCGIPYISLPEEMRPKRAFPPQAVSSFRVGLAWAGSSKYFADTRRSIPLDTFSPLLNIEGTQLVSLQKGEGSRRLHELGWDIDDRMDACNDFLDTAALISELDLVISVDTSIAHLAGALGKPVWLLNRVESEWRWMIGRGDSPWYPTMRIFRQKVRGDWEAVIKQISGELAALAKSGS